MPSRTAALEPEQKVGYAVVVAGFPVQAGSAQRHLQNTTPRSKFRVERLSSSRRTQQGTSTHTTESTAFLDPAPSLADHA